MRELAGKVAFVTGGASGLGLAMARSFAGAGMKVVLADLEEEALSAAHASFGESNAEVIALQVDVTDREALEAAAQQTEAAFGKVHLVCNNAGVAASGNVANATYADWDWVLGANLQGVVNGMQVFVKRLRAHGEGGHIVNTASMAGLLGVQGLCIYNTSKFAVVGLSETAAQDLAHFNIGVSVLCPGFVDTNIYTSERNRPAAYGGSKASGFDLAKEGFLTDAEVAEMQEAMGKMLDAQVIGDMVLHAVQNDEFYILSHPEFAEALATKAAELQAACGRWQAYLSAS